MIQAVRGNSELLSLSVSFKARTLRDNCANVIGANAGAIMEHRGREGNVRLYVPLTWEEFDRLCALAKADRRTPREQAATILASALVIKPSCQSCSGKKGGASGAETQDAANAAA